MYYHLMSISILIKKQRSYVFQDISLAMGGFVPMTSYKIDDGILYNI